MAVVDDSSATGGAVGPYGSSRRSRIAAYAGADSATLSDVDGLDAYLAVRRAAVTSLAADLVATSPVPIEFVSFGDRSATGVHLADIERAGALVRVLAYGPPSRVEALLAAEAVAHDRPQALHVGLSLLPEHAADQAEFSASMAMARAAGAGSVAMYHLGLVDARRREWPAALAA